MSANRIKIEVCALIEGMFVADLDCPWHKTPYPLQGFYVRSDREIKELARFCRYVYVDERKTRKKSTYAPRQPAPMKPQKKDAAKALDQTVQSLTLPPLVIKSPQHYKIETTIKKEVNRASKLHRHVYEAIGDVFSSIINGGEVSVKETEHVAEGMVESVVRNPDALVWLSKMSDEDAYSYQHSVKSSIWALVFGRHLGLDKSLLKTLAMGVLLSHIGKLKLSTELLEKEDALSDDERGEYQNYVQYGVEIVEQMNTLPNGVVSIIKFHQERHNGTGYPQGVTGDRIPLLAKIAGLVDHYQDMINPRNSSQGLSPLQAVSKLFELRNITFQQDLVEQFIEAVGVYPTGTLVVLNSNEVGIVTGHNMDRRLLPRIMVVLDENKQPLKAGKVVDLKEYNKDKVNGSMLCISESLPKGAYNINENEFLLTGAKSRWSWKHLSGSLAS